MSTTTPNQDKAEAQFELVQPTIPLCLHRKLDGRRCAAIAIRNEKFCYWHKQARKQVKHLDSLDSFRLPLLEDARAIQLALTQVIELMIRGRIELKMARGIITGLRMAASLLRARELAEPAKAEGFIGADERCLAQTLLKHMGLPYQIQELAEPPANGQDDSDGDDAEEWKRPEGGQTFTYIPRSPQPAKVVPPQKPYSHNGGFEMNSADRTGASTANPAFPEYQKKPPIM